MVLWGKAYSHFLSPKPVHSQWVYFNYLRGFFPNTHDHFPTIVLRRHSGKDSFGCKLLKSNLTKFKNKKAPNFRNTWTRYSGWYFLNPSFSDIWLCFSLCWLLSKSVFSLTVGRYPPAAPTLHLASSVMPSKKTASFPVVLAKVQGWCSWPSACPWGNCFDKE